MVEKLSFGKTSTPQSGNEWIRYTAFGIICILTVGIFAYAKPDSSELKNPLPENSYYNLLVQGFRDGQLNLKKEAPPGLAKIDHPYNPAFNKDHIMDASDMSYYKGK